MKKEITQNITQIITIAGISICLFSDFMFTGIGLIILSGLLNDKLILSHLIICPLFETAVIISDGISISKVIYGFYILYFIVFLLLKKDKKTYGNDILLIFSFLLLIGSFAIYFSNENGIYDFSFFSIITLNFSRIVILFLLVNFLINQGEIFIKTSTLRLSSILVFVIPLLYFYFQTNNYEINWYNKATRIALVGADPNEFSVIICCVLPYVLLNPKINYLLKIAALIFSGAMIVSLASRGGTIAFLLLFFILPLFIDKYKFATYLLLFAIVFTGLIFFQQNISELDLAVVNRFFYFDDTSTLTSSRFDLWKGSFSAILDSPIIGYGPSNELAEVINKRYSGIKLISHNILIQFIHSFGFVGIIFLGYLIKKYFKYFKINLKADSGISRYF